MKIDKRKIFIITILAVCIISINLAVFLQIIEKPDQDETYEIIDTTLLTENFYNIFDNKLDYQGNNINIQKIDASKDVIYTSYYDEKKLENTYDISVAIPNFNINTGEAQRINQEINNLFYNKATNIVSNINSNTIYNVKYKAYINDNIISLIISATLKEGDNPQRLIIKTYNYNISSNEEITLDKLIEYRKLPKEIVQDKITETIKTSSENAKKYNELGYNKYERDINDNIYKLENTKMFFVGENKALYIIYPYGNSNYTTELDLLVI